MATAGLEFLASAYGKTIGSQINFSSILKRWEGKINVSDLVNRTSVSDLPNSLSSLVSKRGIPFESLLISQSLSKDIKDTTTKLDSSLEEFKTSNNLLPFLLKPFDAVPFTPHHEDGVRAVDFDFFEKYTEDKQFVKLAREAKAEMDETLAALEKAGPFIPPQFFEGQVVFQEIVSNQTLSLSLESL